MARPLRLEFPGAVYHLTARGNARQDVFLDDADRARFLALLGREIDQQRWRCYAYCLMDNHYHLVIETPEANLSTGMRRLNGVYTQAINRGHDRVGHLFQGRYQSILVEREPYLMELCRYVVLNPVRAGVTARFGDWRWSSYRATGLGAKPPAWLDAASVLARFDGDGAAARAGYEKWGQCLTLYRNALGSEHGSAVTIGISGRRLPPDGPGQCPPGRLPRRRGPCPVPRPARPRDRPAALALLCLLSDGQPLPLGDRNSRSQSFHRHAAAQRGLYPGVQPRPRSGWAPLPRALPEHSRRARTLPDGTVPLCGAEPGAGRRDRTVRGLALEQLPGDRSRRETACMAGCGIGVGAV